MQGLLDDVDTIKTATLKKLDQVYQAVMIARRRRLMKIKKQQAEAAMQKQAETQGTGNAPAQQTQGTQTTATGGNGGGRRRLYQNGNLSFRALMDGAGLVKDQPGLYDFGHIPEPEQNFHGLAPPSRAQNPA